MPEPKDDEDLQRPLSAREINRLRQIIEADDRTKWLARTIRVWAAWIAAGIIGVFAVSERLKAAFKAWLS